MSETRKFKKGDRVEYVMFDVCGIPSLDGLSGTVIGHAKSGSPQVDWDEYGVYGHPKSGHCCEYLKLIPQFKPGDRVRAVRESANCWGDYVASEGAGGVIASTGHNVNKTHTILINWDSPRSNGRLHRSEDLELIADSPETQSTDSLIEENRSLSKWISKRQKKIDQLKDNVQKMEEKLQRKQDFFNQNAAELRERTEGAV